MPIPKCVQKIMDRGGIMPGNVIGDLQFSSFIRGADETECNGRAWERGHLQRYDLAGFKRYRGARCVTLALSLAELQVDQCALYVWRRFERDRSIVYGATLAKPNGEIVRTFVADYMVNAADIIAECHRRARLWPAKDRARYYTRDGKRKPAHFRLYGGAESRPDGLAWLHWFNGDRRGRSAEYWQRGWHVRKRDGFSTEFIGCFSTLYQARRVRDSLEAQS